MPNLVLNFPRIYIHHINLPLIISFYTIRTKPQMSNEIKLKLPTADLNKKPEVFTSDLCAGGESNPHGCAPHGPQPCLSASSSTSAYRNYYILSPFPVK